MLGKMRRKMIDAMKREQAYGLYKLCFGAVLLFIFGPDIEVFARTQLLVGINQEKLPSQAHDKTTLSDASYPEMVRIPAGSFVMGEQDGVFISELDTEQREFYGVPNKFIMIDKPFYLGKYEVTFEQYNYYLTQTGKNKKEFPSHGIEDYSNYPIVDITWNESMEYANWLGGQTGRECRLPTEAEWEYAARAGSQTAYPWGDNPGTSNANCKECGSH